MIAEPTSYYWEWLRGMQAKARARDGIDQWESEGGLINNRVTTYANGTPDPQPIFISRMFDPMTKHWFEKPEGGDGRMEKDNGFMEQDNGF